MNQKMAVFMANKARKYCAAFPCFYLAEDRSAYCHRHQPTRAPKETDPFYLTVQWRKFRAWYISRHPICEQCEKEGRLTPAMMVDHILEISDGGALTSEENAQALCHKCHSIKTSLMKNHRKLARNNRAGSQTRT